MDQKFIDETNKLLLQADAEQRAWDATHPEPEAPAPQPKPETRTRDWSGWDKWVKAHIKIALNDFGDNFAGMIGGEVGLVERNIRTELRAEFQAEIAKLTAEIGQLRAEHVSTKGIVDLANWRNKDVA